MRMKRALFLPPFDECAEPAALIEIAQAAEAAGWDGLFLWDHVMRPDPPRPVADPWIALAGIAASTTRIRLGPMVTPLVRRRPQKLAREIATLDRLSNGRLIVGFGLGVDTGRELSAFGEILAQSDRARLLDEGLGLIAELLSGELVHHEGEFFRATDVQFLPSPVQSPVPFWIAARTMNPGPLRRAAGAQGLFPIELTPGELAPLIDVICQHRGGLDGFDVVALASQGSSMEQWAQVGATWWCEDPQPGVTVAEVMALLSR